MRTICITLDCDLHQDYDLPFLGNRERIHVFSRRDSVNNGIKIRVRESIEMKFILEGRIPKDVPCTYQRIELSKNLTDWGSADIIDNDYQRVFLLSGYDYYIIFKGEFEGYLEFSDATQLDCFDATSGEPIIDPDAVKNKSMYYCTLLVDAGDLIKLSSVEMLGLRYSLINADGIDSHVLDYFDNLKVLFIGPESGAPKTPRLDISVPMIRQLQKINIGVQFLMPNIVNLRDCQELYIIDKDISWADLRDLPSKAYGKGEKLTYVSIDSHDESDRDAILRFVKNVVYATKAKECVVTLPYYMKGYIDEDDKGDNGNLIIIIP